MKNKKPIVVAALSPIHQWVQKSSFSSILLFLSAFMALVLANTAANDIIQAILRQKIGFSIGVFAIYKPILLWINDGLMAIFFFVVGLELKREIIAGELSNPKNVVMPIVGAIGGMLLPALIYTGINFSGTGEALNGWGIPMATDIAFALGVLYLLGDKVPIQLKVFLTALAIIDDIGAVAVVAFFYTSQISFLHLVVGFSILAFMFLLNRLGVRNIFLYGVLGIGGVWLAFLLSGVHATIAAVLAAFAIPATRVLDKDEYIENMGELLEHLKKARTEEKEQFLLSQDEENIISEIERISDESNSPLQRLERRMHGLVLYVVMPIFALANAGIVIGEDWTTMLLSPISLGVMIGLLVGKVAGVFGTAFIGIKMGWYKMPENLNFMMIFGVSLLAGIGFTMSLFINSLAFENQIYLEQAKMGILSASFIAGILGYICIKKAIGSKI